MLAVIFYSTLRLTALLGTKKADRRNMEGLDLIFSLCILL